MQVTIPSAVFGTVWIETQSCWHETPQTAVTVTESGDYHRNSNCVTLLFVLDKKIKKINGLIWWRSTGAYKKIYIYIKIYKIIIIKLHGVAVADLSADIIMYGWPRPDTDNTEDFFISFLILKYKLHQQWFLCHGFGSTKHSKMTVYFPIRGVDHGLFFFYIKI